MGAGQFAVERFFSYTDLHKLFKIFQFTKRKIRMSCIHLEEDIKLNQSGRFYFSFNETLRFDDRILRRT